MQLVKITSKGQMTLPIDIRKKMNIKPGEYVSLNYEADGSVRLRKVQDNSPLSEHDPVWNLIQIAEEQASYGAAKPKESDGMEREIERWNES